MNLVSAVTVGAVLVGLAAAGRAEQRIDFSVTEKTWIQRHPIIRVGFDPTHPPFSMVDEFGGQIGIDATLIGRISRTTGLQFNFQRSGGGAVAEERLTSHELDVLMDVEAESAEPGVYVLSSPYLSVPNVLVARADGPFVMTLKTLGDRTVAATRGSALERFLKEANPALPLNLYESDDRAFDALDRDRVFAVAASLPAAGYFVQKNRLTRVKVAGLMDRPFAPRFAVRADWPELVTILDKASASFTEAERRELLVPWSGVATKASAFSWGRIWPVLLVALLGAGATVAAIVRDRKRAWRMGKEKRRLQAELAAQTERASSLRGEKTRILRLATQDVYRPLGEIAAHLEALRAPEGRDGNFAQVTHQILTKVQGIQQAVHALQEMQSLEEGSRSLNLTAVNVGAVVADVLGNFAPAAAKRRVRLSAPAPTKTFLARADVDVLRKVIESLVSSALKISAEDSAISLALWQAEDRVLLTISDEGPGVAVADPKQLDRYHHTASPFEGAETAANYDLALVKNLVLAMEGWLWCESHPGHGATFVIELPVMKQTPSESVSTDDELELNRRSAQRV